MASSDATIARLNASLADRYQVRGEIGQGGMATVYLAEDLKHHRNVAIKVLSPELSAVVGPERFLAEIETTANLQHPNILPLFDSGTADGLLFYVMPYVEGESLRKRLDREKQLPIEEALRIAADVAEALQAAHEMGVIHRDIKPANILLSRGKPLVADFGIALAVSAAGGARLTETGLSLGTPHYMSPEQVTGGRAVGPGTDVYALGCTLYEMLAGDPPYTGGTSQAIVAKILTGDLEPVTTARDAVPANAEAAIRKALQRLPADRFRAAAEFARALADPAFRYGEPQAMGGGASGLWNRLTLATTALSVVLLAALGWSLSRPDPVAPITRYSLALPADQALQEQRGTRVALSPDGSKMVYVGPGSGGSTQLWLRQRDQLTATPIPGSENGVHPFFSPDGSRLGFSTFSPRVLKVTSLSGGAPIVIAETGVALDGATWGPDGWIYLDGLTFGGDTTRGIIRVPATGGDPEVFTTIKVDQGEKDHIWPEALSNGAGVLFIVNYGTGVGDAQIAVAALQTGEHRILTSGARAKYAESGHLIYVTADGSLMARPFDQDRMELSGTSIKLVDGLGIRAFGSVDLTLSASGTMAYITGRPAIGVVEPVWYNRDGRVEQVDPGWADNLQSLALSPDGTRLAVTQRDGAGAEQIWIKDLPNGPLTQLTFGGNKNYLPRWTSNGRAVTFLSERQENADLYLRSADGTGEAQLLLDDERPLGEGAFSRDGDWLLYRLGISTHMRDLYALRPSSDAPPQPIAASGFTEEDVALSPDGRWVAFVSRRSGRSEVHVRPFPDAGMAEFQVSTEGGVSPIWSRDGREIFFRSASNDLIAVEVLPGASFAMGDRRTVTSLAGYVDGVGTYDLNLADGRFIFLRPLVARPQDELILVENFFEELRAEFGG